MYRRTFVLGLLAGLLVQPALAQQTPEPYRDYLLGFQFVPPPGWQVAESRALAGQLSLSQPGSRALILVLVEPHPGQRDDGKPATTLQLDRLGRTLSQKLLQTQLAQIYRDFEVLDRDPGQIGSFQSAQILFRARPRRPNIPEGRVLVCLGGDANRLVTITLVTSQPRYDAVRASLAQVTGSFQLF